METREALLKMKKWVEDEIAKAKLPFQEPFVLTSLVYCATKAVGTGEAENALTLLRSIAKAERMKTCDVVGPYGAIFLINHALTQC